MADTNPHDTPLVMTNFQSLRIECITRFWQEPAKTFSPQEFNTMCRLFSLAARDHILSQHYQGPTAKTGHRDWRDNAGLVIINRDLEELPVELPKWLAIASWMTPESAVSHCPDLVEKIVRSALSNTLHIPPD